MPDVRLLHYFEPTQWRSVSGLDDGKRKTKRGWSPGDSLNLVRVLSVRVNYSQQCRNDINGRWEYSKSIMIHNVRVFYWATNGRPLCIHSATTAICVPSSCLLWATCERPTSSATFVWLFWTCSKLHGDHGVPGDVWTSYVPPLNDQGNRSASLLPSTATWPVLWSHKGGTKVPAPV